MTIPLPALTAAFRSGMSRRADFRGAADANVPIGVVAGELDTATILLAIPKYLGRGGYVFVDSGAFSEVRTGEPPDFKHVLYVYDTIADGASSYTDDLSRLYVVAPDKVGDQIETLNRLQRYRQRVLDLIALGCQVIVPIQCGAMTPSAMLDAAVEVLGTRRFVCGIPSNKAAMSIAECAMLHHHAFHILGRVQQNEEQIQRMAALVANNPGATLTADANWLRSRMTSVCQTTDGERRSRIAQPVQAIWAKPPSRSVAITSCLLSEQSWG